MTGIKLEFEGDPIPWQRARRNKNIYFDPQFKAKKNIGWLAQSFIDIYPPIQNWLPPLSKALRVNFSFFIAMPKSWSKKKRLIKEYSYHDQTPDLSNFVKFYEDCLNNILWVDDCYISELSATKRWADSGKTIIEVLI